MIIKRLLFSRLTFWLKSIFFKGHRTNLYDCSIHLKDIGFYPERIIDVGAGYGTMELLYAFPNSSFLLVEPLREYETNLKKLLKRYKGDYLIAAASNTNSLMTINVRVNNLNGSSLLIDNNQKKFKISKRKIPCFRLDDYCKDKKIKGPILLKIDVQGFELFVVDGCEKILSDIDVIILEVSFYQFAEGAPQFCDIIEYMKSIDFVPYDITSGYYRPIDNALGQVDIFFVKEKSSFRKIHTWYEI